jgi:hypothetical protein
MTSPLSDSWHELRDALRNLPTLREPDVFDAETALVEDALRAVEDALNL